METNYVEERPWGKFEILKEGEGYKVKKITVNPGGRLSLQSHKIRAEHWVVIKGIATIINEAKEIILNISESTFIPAGCMHRLSNMGTEPLEIVEVQTGSYLGEDDITRYDDAYQRT